MANKVRLEEQFNLGQLIKALEAIPDENEKTVCFDFEYAFPTTLDSWRGAYAELALGFDFDGYGLSMDKDACRPLLKDFIIYLKIANGMIFEGWKGGQYRMDENTPVWVSNRGNSGHTAIVNVIDDGYQAILETRFCEY